MFLVNASRAGCEAAGTCSGLRAAARRKYVEDGTSSRLVPGRLHSHQPHQAGQLAGGGADSIFFMTVHSPRHQICRHVVANQPVMGWCDEKSTTQQIELFALAIVLAQHPSRNPPVLPGTDRCLPTTVVQHMRRTVRQQHDISTHQLSRCSRLRILDNGAALDYDVIRDFVCRSLAPGNAPRRTIGTADLELTGYSDDLQEMAQPIDFRHWTSGTGNDETSYRNCALVLLIAHVSKPGSVRG